MPQILEATNQPEVPDSEREAEFWKGHRPKHFTDTLLENS